MSANDPLIGKQLGDYVIQSMLGQGGMARVYKGFDAKLDRYAAVKVIEPNLVASEDDEEYRQRFLREARAIARLNHSHVVGIYQFGQVDSFYYMAMAFIDGRDLRQILKEYNRQDKRLSNEQVLTIVHDIADALDYAHRQGVIHRDVKPSNIMVTGDGHAVLTDFGLALNAQEGTIGNTFGSVHYIAPEQAVSSAQAVAQSDLYSLGVVLYEILTGRVPFEDVSAMSVALKHISDPPPLPSGINPAITREVEEVVIKSLDKDPKKRYPSGAEFIRALDSAFQTPAVTDAVPAAPPVSAPAKSSTSTRPPSPTAILMPSGDATLKSMDDVPTISDSSRGRPGSLPFSPLREKKGRMPLVVGGLVALVILAALAIIVMTGAGGGDDNGEGDLTATARILSAAASATTDALLPPIDLTEEATVTIEPVTATPEPATDTAEPATQTPTSTATNTIEPPTDTPEQTPETTVIVPTEPETSGTISLTALPGEAQVLLRYDGRSLVLYSRAQRNETLNVSGLSFVRDNVTFLASEWSTNDLRSLRSRDCFQVYTTSYTELPAEEFPAEVCDFRQGFRTTSRSFWVNSDPSVMFEVRLDDAVLATCPTVPVESLEQRFCLVDLNAAPSP